MYIQVKSELFSESLVLAAYPKMLNSPHLSDPIVQPDTFKFDCDIHFDTARRDTGFEVKWLFDGKPDANVPNVKITDGTTRQASLDQMALKGHLGQEVMEIKKAHTNKQTITTVTA